MSEEIFKLGDLVWAKMKGFCPWPGRVAKPRKAMKKPVKKHMQCIYFFGSHDYAYIEDSNIKPYLEFKSKLMGSSKLNKFLNAINEIEAFIVRKEQEPDFDPDEEEESEEETDFDKLKEDKIVKVSPPKRAKKESMKRPSTTPKSLMASKRSRISPEENGASPSSFNHVPRIYDEILNRPSVIELPEAPAIDLNDISTSVKEKNIEPSQLLFGFLGLGIMGTGIVKNLIAFGHKVNLWSRTSEKAEAIKTQADKNHPGQVETYATPSDVVANSDIIFCCVSDPAAVKEIVHGNWGVLHDLESLDGKGYVEMTNIDSETTIDISSLITGKGGRYLEAQLQGSKQEAHDGNLIVLGAGDRGLFDECYTCFKAISKTVFYLSEVGYASKMNLVLQIMKGVSLLGMAEGLALAERSGLAMKDVLEIFSLTGFSSPYLIHKADLIKNMKFKDVEQPLQHMQKDLKLALQLGDCLKHPLLMTSTANEVYKHVRRLGYDTYDVASVYMRTRH